jgi:hypothetical protein
MMLYRAFKLQNGIALGEDTNKWGVHFLGITAETSVTVKVRK